MWKKKTKEKQSVWYDFLRAIAWIGVGIALGTYFGTTTVTFNGNVITSNGEYWLSLLLIVPDLIRSITAEIIKPIYGMLTKQSD